jgi:serine protease Do
MNKTRYTAVLFSVALLLGACSFGDDDESAAPQQPRPAPARPVTLDQDARPAPRSSVARVVDDVLPSVVNVRVTAVGVDPLFGESQEAKAQGSGVIVDENGTILTNNHVIAQAVDVTVAFTDGREPVDGEVIGRTPERDLAVVKVEAEDLDAVPIGNSRTLELGTDVIAIGFPLGLGGPTVTKGIISGKDRSIRVGGAVPELDRLGGLLQTDAAINPGNSGGPLMDLSGRLVGINTAAAQAGTAENIGFAIPIDEALPVVEEILSRGPSNRAWLGVQIGTLTQDAAAQLDVDPDLEGAVIVGIFPDTPAEDAGLEEGDVIVAVDGESIESSEDLTKALTEHQPGESVELEIVNADGTETVDVELDRRPSTF